MSNAINHRRYLCGAFLLALGGCGSTDTLAADYMTTLPDADLGDVAADAATGAGGGAGVATAGGAGVATAGGAGVAAGGGGAATDGSADTGTSGGTSTVDAGNADGQAGDAGLPVSSIADASVMEGDTGMAQLAFVVTLSAASTSQVTVDYATADGTAVSAGGGTGSGRDYTAASGTVTFAAGETEKTINVSVIGDRTLEPDETIKVDLSNAAGATIGDSQAVGTIQNDD